MFIPSVADLQISGPFSVIDANTGNALHTFAAANDEPDDMPPDAASWPVLSIRAEAGILIITTRPPKLDPREDLRRTREEYLRRQYAPYTPGTRRLY